MLADTSCTTLSRSMFIEVLQLRQFPQDVKNFQRFDIARASFLSFYYIYILKLIEDLNHLNPKRIFCQYSYPSKQNNSPSEASSQTNIEGITITIQQIRACPGYLYNFYLLSPMDLQRPEPHFLPMQKNCSLSAWLEEEVAHLNQTEDKNEDMFFKSQVSLAETCEEQTPRCSSFSQDILDEDNLSFDSLNLHQCMIEGEICQDFVLNGSCMKGEGCDLGHRVVSERQEKKRNKVRMWLWQEMPQLVLSSLRRANSFLG